MSPIRILFLAFVAGLIALGAPPRAEAGPGCTGYRVTRYIVYYRSCPDCPWTLYNRAAYFSHADAAWAAARLGGSGFETFIRRLR